jgi:predicted glutamine amidotransferase
MHNGVIGDWPRVRRRVEGLIPDALYGSRVGTTDSEAVFLAIMGAGVERDPIGATLRTLGVLTKMVNEEDRREPLRFTSTLANGRDLYAFRYAANTAGNSLYFRTSGADVVIVSEPLDRDHSGWTEVPENHIVAARANRPAELVPFELAHCVAAE